MLGDEAFTRDLLRGRRRGFKVRRSRGPGWGLILALLVCWCAALLWLRRDRSPDPDRVAQGSDSPLRTLVAPAIRWDRAAPGVSWQSGRPTVTDPRPRGAIEPGQTLFEALSERGAEPESLQRAVGALAGRFDFRRSRVGHTWEADLQPSGRVDRLRYQVSPERYFESRRRLDGSFAGEEVKVPVEARTVAVGIPIVGSLWASVEAAGQPPELAGAIADALQWDLDLSSSLIEGDSIRVVFDRLYLQGQPLRTGDVHAVEYVGAKAHVVAVRFEDERRGGFYAPDGSSLTRLFLAAPCRYRRMTSPFDPNRLHPVLKIRRPHLGVDYAAPTGTPVRAVADGVVAFVGPRGGNGNLVSVRHDLEYESGYAHLSRFARGLKVGQRVEQGQVIGFVGSTGLSTGPHLHFGLKHQGRFVDPLARRDIRPPSLQGRALSEFKRRSGALREQLDRIVVDAPRAPRGQAEQAPVLSDEAGEF